MENLDEIKQGGGRVIDVGDDIYNIDADKSVNLGFKSRNEFLKTFGDDARTELLLLKYLPLKLHRKIEFKGKQGSQDKEDLLQILKTRLKSLHNSKEFSSSVLKNTVFQKYYQNILLLINKIEDPDLEKPSDITTKCEKDVEYTKKISNVDKDDHEEVIFKKIIGLAWYLLNPERVPKEIQCEWADIIQNLDTVRIEDIVKQLKTIETEKGKLVTDNPLNYFKSIQVRNLKNTPDIKDAGERIKGMVRNSDGSYQRVKNHLMRLILLLEMKKYLKKPADTTLRMITNADYQRFAHQMTDNPFSPPSPPTVTPSMKKLYSVMGGGAEPLSDAALKIFNKSLYAAMTPLYDHLKTLYNPVYGYLYHATKKITSTNHNNNTRRAMIPELLQLLYVTTKISEKIVKNDNSHYGIYHITHMSASVLSFIKSHFKQIQEKVTRIVGNSKNDSEKTVFLTQVIELPEVRLSSIITNTGGTPVSTEQPVYMQFLMLNENMTIPTRDTFLKEDTLKRTEDTYDALTDFIKENELYVLCTPERGVVSCDEHGCGVVLSDIPMNIFEIDFQQVDIDGPDIIIDELSDHYFRRPLTQITEFNFDRLVQLELQKIYTNSELVLSIFIMSKELMPK